MAQLAQMMSDYFFAKRQWSDKDYIIFLETKEKKERNSVMLISFCLSEFQFYK